MQCTKCDNHAVYRLSDQLYCKDHFCRYFENKVYKTIKKFSLFRPDDKIAVASSGGKDSLALLYTVMLYTNKYNIPFFALAVDEGIAGYRDSSLDDLKFFCSQFDIKYHIVSFQDKINTTLDNIKDKGISLNKKPCTVCGIFRRTLLNRAARELGATKLATGHNLDDEAQSLLMNTMKGNMSHNAALGPVTGLSSTKGFVQRVKPLYFMLEKETRLYAFIKNFKVDFNECPNISLSFRAGVRDILNNMESTSPGTKNGIVNSFLEILPLLKEKYRNEKPFSFCERCNDPCSGKICNACQMEDLLCLKVN